MRGGEKARVNPKEGPLCWPLFITSVEDVQSTLKNGRIDTPSDDNWTDFQDHLESICSTTGWEIKKRCIKTEEIAAALILYLQRKDPNETLRSIYCYRNSDEFLKLKRDLSLTRQIETPPELRVLHPFSTISRSRFFEWIPQIASYLFPPMRIPVAKPPPERVKVFMSAMGRENEYTKRFRVRKAVEDCFESVGMDSISLQASAGENPNAKLLRELFFDLNNLKVNSLEKESLDDLLEALYEL